MQMFCLSWSVQLPCYGLCNIVEQLPCSRGKWHCNGMPGDVWSGAAREGSTDSQLGDGRLHLSRTLKG